MPNLKITTIVEEHHQQISPPVLLPPLAEVDTAYHLPPDSHELLSGIDGNMVLQAVYEQ
jgi:hypothetical protein